MKEEESLLNWFFTKLVPDYPEADKLLELDNKELASYIPRITVKTFREMLELKGAYEDYKRTCN